MKKILLSIVILLHLTLTSNSQTRKQIDRSTDVLMFVTPVAGLASSLILKDYRGSKQLILSGSSCLLLTYLLKYTISKDRPDHSDSHAFPSNHTSISFMGAAFIQKRYGWKWGIPAYLLSAYIGWGRTYAKQHDWWDVAAGALIGTGCSYIFTRSYCQKHRLTVAPQIFNGKYPGLYASIVF